MNESAIQSKIITWINAQPGCIAENVRGNATQSGRADINACIKGRCVKIEVKRPDSSYDTTSKQELYLKRWKRAGAHCFSCESLKEAQYHITKLLHFEMYLMERYEERGLTDES